MSTDQAAVDALTIAAAADDPLLASVATDKATTITPIPLSALPAWRLLDVLWHGPAHPVRWIVAVDDDRAIVITGHPERWEALTVDAEVTTAEQAIELACVRTDAVRDMAKGYRRLSRAADISFRLPPTHEARSVLEMARTALAEVVTPPSATGHGPWTVTLWTLTDGALVRHEVVVARDGSTTETTLVAAEDLPVPLTH